MVIDLNIILFLLLFGIIVINMLLPLLFLYYCPSGSISSCLCGCMSWRLGLGGLGRTGGGGTGISIFLRVARSLGILLLGSCLRGILLFISCIVVVGCL